MIRPVAAPLLAAALAGTVALAGCEQQPSDAGPGIPVSSEAIEAGDRYVALGDSYTASPFADLTAPAEGCFRSTANYPTLVAERLDLALADVSCSGATTGDVTGRQRTVTRTTLPPQVAAVTPDTDLVTLSIGANDFNLFGDLMRQCPDLAGQDRDGAPCADADRAGGGSEVARKVDRIRGRVIRVVEAVVDRAPDARVVVVGYPQIVPAEGTCRELPLARGDYAFARRVNELLVQALAAAADAAAAEYVDVYAATEGHDICGDEPWITGVSTQPPAGLPYHPLQPEQERVADLLVRRLT